MKTLRVEESGSTWYVYKATLVAAVGGLLFGYDTAVIAGAIGFLQRKFDLSAVMVGWVASCALIGCTLGAMLAGWLTDRYGRKKILILSAILFAVSSAGIAIPASLDWFVGLRIIGGLGIGIASMLAPMYITEIAPSEKRGRLVSINQLGIVTGILLIYFVNAWIARLNTEAWNVESGWRWMFGSGTLPALLFLVLLFLVPESPRWLAKQGRLAEALAILSRINGPQKGRTELAGITNELMNESRETMAELLKPGLRRALLIGIVLAMFSQITGINAIMYYAPEIFKSTGDGSGSALTQTILVGIINLCFTIVAIKYVDQAGRKKLLMAGSGGMALCLAVLGGVFYLGLAKGYLVLLSILAYIAFFALSLGPLTFVVIAEIFPTRVRGLAMSVSIFVLWLSVFAISQLFPMLLAAIGSAYTFWIFMAASIAAFVFIWRVIPETKGKSLEEMEALWASG